MTGRRAGVGSVSVQRSAASSIRWGRVVVGGFLIEAVLLVLAVPLLFVLDNPLVEAGQGGGRDFTVFFVLVAAMCAIAGGLGGRWVARPLSSALALHGALTGVLATAIYLAVCSIPPNTIGAVVAGYGPAWFVVVNGLRIAGGVAGAVSKGRTA